MSMPNLPYEVNLLDDGSVITQDGALLGTWAMDSSGTIYQFIPDGSAEVLIEEVFKAAFCSMILEWRDDKSS